MQWYEQNERGGAFWLKLSFILVCYLPRAVLTPIVHLIAFIYYIFSPRQRRNLREFYTNLNAKFGTKKFKIYSNFYEFASSIIDKFNVWMGRIKFSDLVLENEVEIVENFFNSKRGKIAVISHFGNIEIARALSKNAGEIKMAILVYSKNSSNFANMINQLSKSKVLVFEVDELDVAVMMRLSEFIESGGFICVMVDRIPLSGTKVCEVEFLGVKTNFPQGGFIMASILKCDVITLWCVKKEGRYHIKVENFAQQIDRRKICSYVQHYAELLERQCEQNPQAWFNFYDFWGKYDTKKL